MAQFDYYANPNPRSREWAPYLVDLQHDMLRELGTRIMAPLLLAGPVATHAMQRLNPIITIDGQELILSSAEMAAVPLKELGECRGNLAEYRAEILAGIDLLFTAV